MEELNQVACESLCREHGLYPTIVGGALASVIAVVLALCLGYV